MSDLDPDPIVQQAPGEPWTLQPITPPTYAHVVEVVDPDERTDAVYETRPGGGYSVSELYDGHRHRSVRTWQQIIGVAWSAGLTVRVCPLGYARHARFGAVRILPMDPQRRVHREEVVIAGPPVVPGGDPDGARRWVSLTDPGIRYTDDEVDRPPWRALEREAAWRHLIPPDPS